MKDSRAARMLGLTLEDFTIQAASVRERLKDSEGSKVRLAVSLYTFRAMISGDVEKSFLRVCAAKFALDASLVSRCLGVIRIFGNEKHTDIVPEYREYSFSLLAEMLSLPEEERSKVKSCWTVKNVRDFKKLLEKSEKQEVEEIAEKEKPEDEYARFKKWNKAQLCKEILRLEEKIRCLEK